MPDLVPIDLIPVTQALPMENEARFISAINQIADLEFVPYLREAWLCYVSQTYNASLIWIWCAVSCYIRAVVQHVGEDLFRFHFDGAYESLERVNDEQLLETCRKMGLLGFLDPARFGWVNDFRTRRNDLAHGKWNELATPKIVTDFAEGAVRNLLCRSVKEHDLSVDTATLYEFVKFYTSPLNEERAAALIILVTGEFVTVMVKTDS